MQENAIELGRIIRGSISGGIIAYLKNEESIENYPLGSLVAIHGESHKYLALITDVGIESSNQADSLIRPKVSEEFREATVDVYKDRIRNQWVKLALIAQVGSEQPKTADTMPSFFSILRNVTDNDVKNFFGIENYKTHWNVGTPKVPKGLSIEIPIDVEKLVELSFAIYGKSGTGKTFLGNLLAGYIISYDLMKERVEQRIKLLIFDMHSEYALELKDNMGNKIANGIAYIFRDFFLRYTPDEYFVKERGLKQLKINYAKITETDIRMLSSTFGITETFINYLPRFKTILAKNLKLKDLWIWGLLLDAGDEDKLTKTDEGLYIIEEIKKRANVGSLEDFREKICKIIHEKIGPSVEVSFRSQTTKLKRLLDYPYTIDNEKDTIEEIINNILSIEGKNVTISMGRFEKETPLYMMIANLLARRLREKILEKSSKGETLETKIVIFLEEAHNFLGKEVYRQSPFGEIAREMRKKGVITVVIDQRPSELDPDVIGMIWTNFVFTLTDIDDIKSSLMGAPHSELFRNIIPNLASREVLIYGEAVRFPAVLKVKDYNIIEKFFNNLVKKINKEILERRKSIEGEFL
jgi:DNA helicase HerA-like ATPase